ncbi:hypothetical protein T492DRAFT_834904 [Pavlovales sp. CCMP2436]|nr:hypothetical protein T492DRAFT_834904 [Pavlovales sp. CCMP2436]
MLPACLAARLMQPVAFAPARHVLSRRSLGIETTLSERERAAEAVYFKKEEKELIKKLAKKLGMPGEDAVEAEEAAIVKILAKHGVLPPTSLTCEIVAYFNTHAH